MTTFNLPAAATILSLLFLTLPHCLSAQTGSEPCGSDILHQKTLSDPEFRKNHEAFEQGILQHIKKGATPAQPDGAGVTLPVVVHIVHQNGAENISDAQVLQGIQQLNEAFANMGYYDQGSGTNAMIQFCLAKRNPDNLSANGITRDQNSLTDMTMESEDLALKNLNRWDPTQYINIWLVREICSAGSGCGVAGYAYFPSAHGSGVDGIVMEARWFGSSPGNTGVLAHEMGHYLGLYHTFQGGCANNDCLIDGDRVCDTPPDNSTLWVPCDAQVNTCTTDAQSGFATDQNDMILNFMDYTDFDCFHDFTQGQSDRMNAAIQTTRVSLLSSKACNDPCPQPAVAAFTPASATIPVGQSLNFTNASQNAVSYNWSVAGVPFSNAVNAAYTFSAEGIFIVTLQANSATPDLCGPDTATAIIQVICPVTADFQVSTLNPAAGETVIFTNTSQNATQFEWFVDGISQGPALNSYTFNQTGVYIVRLEAGNGLCKKTKFQYVAVKDSCSDFSFQKTWGGSGDDQGIQTALLSDGNFITAGHTPGPGAGYDIVFLKTAPDGSLIWQKKYGGAGDDGVRALTPMPDGGWVLAGYSSSMGANLDPIVARFSADGTVLWQKIMITAPGSDYFTDVKRTADGQLILAGALKTSGNLGFGNYLGKLDAGNGNTLWSRIYDAQGADFIQNVTELASGGFAACGFTLSYGQNLSAIHDGMVLRTDASGNLLWTKAIGSVENEWFTNIFETSDGGLMMTGSTSGWNGPGGGQYLDDGWLVKTTGNGNLLWSNIYRCDQILDYGSIGVVQEKDGSLVWAANDPAAFGANTPHFFKTDASGKLLWSRIYQGTDQGRILDVSALPDGYLFTGYYIAGGNRDICLLKTDAAGLAGQCDEIPHNMLVQSVQPLVVNGQLNTLQAPALQNANLTADAAALNESILCPPDCLDEPPPCKSFQNTYGTTADERGITGIEMPGGGYLVGGNITQNGDQNILITRLDAAGEVLWSKQYGESGVFNALADLQVKPDGSFFMSYALGTPTDAGFAVCDANGNVQFARRVNTSSGSQTDSFSDIIATSDGGYLIAGSFSPNDNTNWSSFFLKMDANGATQWYRGWNGNRTDFVTGVRELPGGGYIASGYGNSYGLGGPHDGVAYRIDANGNLLWTRAYGTSSDGGFSDVAIAADGGFLFAAGLWNFNTPNTPEGGIVRTDANGNLLWTRIYRPSNNLDWETAGLVNTPDGNFVIAGRNRPNTGDTKAYLLKIDASGQLIWSKQYGGPGQEALYDVRALTSGDLLWTGRTTSAGSGSGDFYVLKTDADGFAGLCAETSHTTAAVPLQITQTNGSLQELTPPALQNLSITVQNIAVTKTEICAPDCDTPEICNNGLDDDGDNLFDCLDPDCDCHNCDGSETNIWYFGRQAGLNFADNPPLILTDGKTNTNEASAVASDPLGRLIFYTDAKTVYQRNHTPMPNGSGLFGHGSSSQTLIVPHPGNSALFYVFTPDSYDNGPLRGLSYTVVDMSLNNGFGDVPAGQKNLPLTPASELVEQISAVRHCNGTDFWVLNHRKTSNAFLAYRIDQNGLNATPVVSNAGTGGPAPNGNYNVIGQMKISPDGLRLARALYHTNAAEVFDFDPATGIVSNPVLLQTPGLINPYGVEFSPAGRFLYGSGLGNPASLFQFDLLAGDAAAVAASAVQLASFPGIYHYGQLQLAKNGKIYTTNSGPGVFTTQLGVIHYPDEAGAGCLYQENGQALTGTPGANLSLPNFLVSYFWKPAVWFEETNLEDTICQLPVVQTYSLKKLPCGVQSVDFQVSGAGTLLNQTKETVTVRFDQAGQVTIVAHAVALCGEARDTLQITVLEPGAEVLDLGPDITVCDNGVTVLDAGPGFPKYRWYDGSEGQTNTPIAVPGKYWVDVWDQCGNKQSDTLEIKLIPATKLDLGPDPATCTGSAVSYQLPAPFTAWHWYPGDYLSCADCPTVVTTAPPNTTYIIVGQIAGGCLSADTITIQVSGDTVLNQLQLFTCPGEPAVWNGQPLTPGAHPFPFTAANGCDSTVLVTVLENDTALAIVPLTACPGRPAVWNGQSLTPGAYPFVFTAANGCDSTIVVTVLENDSAFTTIQLTTCPGEPAVWNGQPLAPGAHPFVFTAVNGCDSTVLVTVLENDTTLTAVQLTTCPGEPAVWNGQPLMPGVYPFIFTAANGCDSTMLVTVLEKDSTLSAVQLTTCPGEPAVWNGQPLMPGVYPFIFTAANGCDSTMLVTVLENDSTLTAVQLTTCPGEPAVWNGQPLTPGVYPIVFTAANGCDSTMLVTVLEKDSTLKAVLLTTCPGEPAVWNGQPLAPGAHPFVFTAANGCDSTILVTVLENDTAFTAVQLSACAGEPAVWNGQPLMPGTYPFILTTVNGCDSTVLVTVLEQDTALTAVLLTACPGQPVLWNGQPLAPGDHSFVFTTANGCDSTVLVTVILLPAVTVELPQVSGIELGGSVQLFPVVSGKPPLQYAWTPPDHLDCNDCAEPVASPFSGTWYTLKVTDANGCMAADSVFVGVNPVCNIYLPNAFRPDDDGRNDRFFPSAGPCVRTVRILRVFGRWGELVFENRDFAPDQELSGWDGRFRQRDLQPGVFAWYAVFELVNGQEMTRSGNVTLVR